MNKIFEIKYWLLYLTVFTLPMFTRLNNIFLGLFIFLSIMTFFTGRNSIKTKRFLMLWPIWIFFPLAVIGSINGSEGLTFITGLERYWSFFLVPLAFSMDTTFFKKRRRHVFFALLFGCLATLLICYLNLVYEMVLKKEPLNNFFTWRHVGYRFTEIADSHPTYLGLFLVVSILFLIQDRIMDINLRLILLIFLFFGLFQLADRMALLLFILFLVFFLVKRAKEYRNQLFILILGMVACAVVFNHLGSEYMKKRLFSKESVVDVNRFNRWIVSYEIFKEHPIMGTGFYKIEDLRAEKYIEHDFYLANRLDLNAHNQFLEYLSRNGLIGGFAYVIALTFLLLLSMYRRDYLFSFIFFAFIMANMTESMLVRIKGIEFFALFSCLFLNSKLNNTKKET